jgi:hypothetical protein
LVVVVVENAGELQTGVMAVLVAAVLLMVEHTELQQTPQKVIKEVTEDIPTKRAEGIPVAVVAGNLPLVLMLLQVQPQVMAVRDYMPQMQEI